MSKIEKVVGPLTVSPGCIIRDRSLSPIAYAYAGPFQVEVARLLAVSTEAVAACRAVENHLDKCTLPLEVETMLGRVLEKVDGERHFAFQAKGEADATPTEGGA